MAYISQIIMSVCTYFAKAKSVVVSVPMFSVLCFAVLLCSCGNEPETPRKTQREVKVVEYRPAMGQFVNLMPAYVEGYTENDMCREAEKLLNGSGLITLGGFGGYVTLYLEDGILNGEGYDFRVLGNAFCQQGETEYGSSEPGVVWVSEDSNANALPDDEWYQLAGSDYYLETTQHHYRKTWHKSDTTLLNSYHTQPYFPQWLNDTVIEVEGTLLASATTENAGMWVQHMRQYGYVDNRPNSDVEGTSFNLDWAVDDNGKHVDLSKCHFVRIVTAVDEVYQPTGELSTEVASLVVIE